MPRCVQLTRELHRILTLPSRDWQLDASELVEPMTRLLMQPDHVCEGKECPAYPALQLVPAQAASLADMHDHGGLFLQGEVGLGKTLLSGLLPSVQGSDRVLLLVPADLKPKTTRELRKYRAHWNIGHIRIESYELMSRDNAAQLLRTYFDGASRPMIVLDEAQYVKNTKAACTRRIERFLKFWREENNRLIFVAAMSGTTAKRSIKDCAHIMRWCLPHGCPLPTNFSDITDWSAALDGRVSDRSAIEPGALRLLKAHDAPWVNQDEARALVGKRMFSTPGIINARASGVSASLRVTTRQIVLSPAEDDAYRTLRGEPPPGCPGWETPDGHPIADAVQLWRHALEIQMGFFYRWDPRPPEDWLGPRREWCSAVRAILSNNGRELDTEKQVADEIRAAIAHGRNHVAKDAFLAWEQVKETFLPNTVPVWLGSTMLDYAASWAEKNRGIVWSEHRAFNEELSRRTGMSYYARKGMNAQGGAIEADAGERSIIASVPSNHKGRNLQKVWSQGLIVSCLPTGMRWSQLLGRMHRPGQQADEVRWDVAVACAESLKGFHQAIADGRFHEDFLQTPAKLCTADICEPTYRAAGWAWAEQRKQTVREVDDRIEALRPTG